MRKLATRGRKCMTMCSTRLLLICHVILAVCQNPAVLAATLPQIDDALGANTATTSPTALPAVQDRADLGQDVLADVAVEGEAGGVDEPRAIMEDFADDFLSPADDVDLDSELFNREPFYYDAYYDSNYDLTNEVDDEVTSDDPPITTMTPDAAEPPHNSSSVRYDATAVQEALDLRLLGANLQSELEFVLQDLTNTTQRNRRHQIPVRHQDHTHEGIAVGPREGTCPPPIHSLPRGLCGVPPCTSHMMCYPHKMCCFNGCTYTCTEPVTPPAVIDWVEDTGSRLPLLDPSNPLLPLKFESSPLSYGTGGGETIRLPGGCSLSAHKYDELKQFMTADSIQDCMCSGGEVVCVVKSSP